MTKNKWITGVLVAGQVLITGGCTVPDAGPTPYELGTVVVNAGSPSGTNGSISFLPRNTGATATDIFNAANAQPLNGMVQDYTEVDGKGIILVNNTETGKDRIEIVESGTFKTMTTLQTADLENPRFVAKAGFNKAYVSCWDTTGSGANLYRKPGYILVVNLASRTVSKKIPVTKGPERIVVVGNKAYIGSAGGERVLTVINTDTDEVQPPGIDAGVNANPVASDANGKLWAYVASSKEMVRINPIANVVETRLTVGNSAKSPGAIALSADGRTFYFVNSFNDPADGGALKGETYRFSVTDLSIPAAVPFIRRVFSGLGVDPRGIVHAGVSPSPNQPGYVLRYQPGGALIDSVRAEFVPSKFYFR